MVVWENFWIQDQLKSAILQLWSLQIFNEYMGILCHENVSIKWFVWLNQLKKKQTVGRVFQKVTGLDI